MNTVVLSGARFINKLLVMLLESLGLYEPKHNPKKLYAFAQVSLSS